MMGDQEEILAELAAIRALGVKLHVDDFGAGYSSLSQLQRMKMDVLKIDRSFTAELGRSKEGTVFFQEIVSMAHALGMEVVSEGVESAEQLAILRTLGCNEGPRLPDRAAAEAIVIGRVPSEQRIQEDADDPDGVTVSNMTIKVLKNLKGSPPSVIVVRNENTSSRYPMSVGEEYIPFVSRTNLGIWIDSCGNSEAMPHGEQVAKRSGHNCAH